MPVRPLFSSGVISVAASVHLEFVKRLETYIRMGLGGNERLAWNLVTLPSRYLYRPG